MDVHNTILWRKLAVVLHPAERDLDERQVVLRLRVGLVSRRTPCSLAFDTSPHAVVIRRSTKDPLTATPFKNASAFTYPSFTYRSRYILPEGEFGSKRPPAAPVSVVEVILPAKKPPLGVKIVSIGSESSG